MQGDRAVIIPSIASGNMLNVEEEIKFIDGSYGHIHIDIEDGNYIPNITFGEKLLKLICENSSSFKSIHLMVNNPGDFLKTIKECKPDIVFLHTDATRYPSELIKLYQDEGIRVGIAINPGISINEVEYVLPMVEDILVLTCEPDGRGQKYIKLMEDKIRRLNDYRVNIWVDGGVTENQINNLIGIGVKNIVMGRAVFTNRDRIIKSELKK
jgi:ribulose-phosphate 3-epimerase